MVKEELSFDSIMYVIILIQFPYVFILIGRRSIFRSSTRNGSSGFNQGVRDRGRNGGKNDVGEFSSSTQSTPTQR